MFGGTSVYEDGVYFKDVYTMAFCNPRGYEWQRLEPSGAPPAGRADHVMVYDPAGKRMIIFGGSPGVGRRLNDLWELDLTPGAEAWHELTPNGTPPSARAYACGAYVPSRNSIIIFSGSTAGGFANDVWELQLSDTSWHALSPSGNAPLMRSDGCAAWDAANNRVLFFGGRGSSFLNDLWALSLDTDAEQWTQLSPGGPVPETRCGFASASTGDRLFICAGWNESYFFNNLYMLDFASLTWTAVNPSGEAPAPRRNTTGFWDYVHSNFFVCCGEYAIGGYLSDTYFVDLGNVGVTEWWESWASRGGLRLRVTGLSDIRIECFVATDCQVRLRIVDANGRQVRQLHTGLTSTPSFTVTWDGRDDAGKAVSSGTYFCTAQANGAVATEKVIVLR